MNSHNVNIPTEANPYTTLELTSSATSDEIKKAYRRLALKHHPDRNEGSTIAAKKFQLISSAYERLTNPSHELLLSSQDSDFQYFAEPDPEDLITAQYYAILHYINQWDESSKKLPQIYLKKVPQLHSKLKYCLEKKFITPDYFKKWGSAYTWQFILNVYRCESRIVKAGSIPQFQREFLQCPEVTNILRSKKSQMRNCVLLFALNNKFQDYFNILFKINYPENFICLKWNLLNSLLIKYNSLIIEFDAHDKLEIISRIFDGPNSAIQQIFDKVIIPIQQKITALKDKNDALSISKAKQLEVVIEKVKEHLLNEIPKIIQNDYRSPHFYYLDVLEKTNEVIKLYSNEGTINYRKNLIGDYLRIILGSLIVLSTLGMALISENFRHRFFYTHSKSVLLKTNSSIKSIQRNYCKEMDVEGLPSDHKKLFNK